MITKEQAIELAESGWWKDMDARDVATVQLFEPLLCMPFDEFHSAVEKALGRPVFTHEFGLNMDGLRAELMGDKPAPTLQEILELFPADKRVIVVEAGK